MTRPTNILRNKPLRNAFGRGLPTATSCLPKCARIVSSAKELTQTKSGQAPKAITETQNWIQDKTS